jgi:hypothetical protein
MLTEQKIKCPMGGYDPVESPIRYIMTGAYFDTYKGQTQESIQKNGVKASYAVKKGLSPKTKGGVRLTFKFTDEKHSVLEVKATL